MNMEELIALATIRSGQTRGELASEMGHAYQSKITRLAKGLTEPTASEVVFLAEKAQLPILQTLADIEAANHPHFAKTWRDALKRIKEESIRKL